MFGASERQGFGKSLIYKTAILNDEKLVLRYIVKNGADKSLRELAPIFGITEYRNEKYII